MLYPTTLPLELDPEVAVRPIRGSRALEIAVGARVVPVAAQDRRYAVPIASPRVRVEVGGRGARVFAEAERYWHQVAGSAVPVNAVRVLAGLELDLGHVGVAVGPRER